MTSCPIWSLNEFHIPLKKSGQECQELVWLKEEGRCFCSGLWKDKGDQKKARCLSWIFMMNQVLETQAETEKHDFTTEL